MRRSPSICAHLLRFQDTECLHSIRNRCAHARKILVIGGALDFYRPLIQEKSFFGIPTYCTDAKGGTYCVDELACFHVSDFRDHGVEFWEIQTPQHNRSCIKLLLDFKRLSGLEGNYFIIFGCCDGFCRGWINHGRCKRDCGRHWTLIPHSRVDQYVSFSFYPTPFRLFDCGQIHRRRHVNSKRRNVGGACRVEPHMPVDPPTIVPPSFRVRIVQKHRKDVTTSISKVQVLLVVI
mmetsp:Transcript_31169/g.76037  ORF Transcript_31169/g.76037 Transcript_31169/m.76037 type:complete len:235 (+) Transcript_31169:1567-2271(+)